MSRLKWAFLSTVVALAGVWLLARTQQAEDATAKLPSPSVSNATVQDLRAPDPNRNRGLYDSNSDPTRPDLTIESTLGPARAGDAAAMRDLSRALKLCAFLQASDEEAVVARQLWLAESYKQFARDTGAEYDSVAVDAEFDGKAAKELQIKKVCSSIAREDTSSWLAWLEQAAAAGDLEAKLEYANAVLSQTAGVNWMFANLQETARQKQRAFDFLKEVADSGDCTVSEQMEILAPTPSMAYAYSLVSFERNRAPPGFASAQVVADDVAFMQRQVDLKSAKLSPTERASARAISQSVLRKCR